jgi:hypothetical protein
MQTARASMQETAYFEGGDVVVTNARFIARGKTYAMRNVTSVGQGQIPVNRAIDIILFCVTVAFAFASAWGAVVFFGIITGIVFFSRKKTFAVMLHTSGNEVKALLSKDEAYVAGVVAALNQAMIHQAHQ